MAYRDAKIVTKRDKRAQHKKRNHRQQPFIARTAMKAKGAMKESKRALNALFDTLSARQDIGNAAHMGAFRSSIDSFLHADDLLFGDKNVTKCL